MGYSAHIVIGAAYGDEGKGYLVDRLSNHRTLVVRFNGGAQAGHTVVNPRFGRHVFSHIGAGTFRGADTYLSKDFIINPMMFVSEYNILTQRFFVKRPRVAASPDCRVTTFYDAMYNQWLENNRGDARHGSCGMGINATVDRDTVIPLRMDATLDFLQNVSLPAIREYYESKGFDIVKFLCSEEAHQTAINRYLEEFDDTKILISSTHSMKWNGYERVVFEGAQGLLLDEFHQNFPYVTRSRTGLSNFTTDGVIERYVDDADYVEVVYVSRPYLTRHGRGPFVDDADSVHACFDVVDPTNVPNPWQETLRLGLYNHDLITLTAKSDFTSYTKKMWRDIMPVRAITCMEQLRGNHIDTTNGMVHVNDFKKMIEETFDGGAIFGYGEQGMRRVQWVR